MPLEPLATPDTKQEAEKTTFRERKMAQLQEEAAPDAGQPDAILESASDESQISDNYHEETDEEDVDTEVDTEEDGALFEEQVEEQVETDDDPDDPPAEYWQDKYENMEKEFRRVTANRKSIEQELSDGIQGNITLRHTLEDANSEAINRAQFFLNMANTTVTQYEQMDWNQVQPEQIAATKAAYQKAVAQRDQITRLFGQVKDAQAKDLETTRQREAEVSRSMLARRIPNWSNDYYGALRDHATELGYTREEFNQLTDWRPIYLIHESLERRQAVSKVRDIKRKSKAKAPGNRNARQPERNARGRFKKSREKAFERPGDKQSFRDMKFQQLERERTRR